MNKKIELGDAEIEKYLAEIEENDSQEQQNIEPSELTAKLEELQKWNTKYKGYKAELERRMEIDPEITQISLTGKDKAFTVVNFEYQKETDTYTCPNKKTLTTNGSFYEKKDRKGQIAHRFKRYKVSFSECSVCPFKEKCLSKSNQEQHHGRNIERMECQDASDENKARVSTTAGKALYKKRQGIVEHPFGVVKRQWDCSYTLLRSKEKVTGEFAIVWTCYNLRRAMSILTVNVMLDKLKVAKLTFFIYFRSLYERFYTIHLAHIIFLCFFAIVA